MTRDEALPSVEPLLDAGPCLVVNKPSGLATQAPPGISSLEEWVRSFWSRREGKTHRIYVGVPHRLDRPTSGAIVFCRNVRATRRLSEQFQARRVEKSYLALVEGHPPDSATLMHRVKKVADEPRVIVVEPHDEAGQPAVLRFERWYQGDAWALLHVRPETGRMHQIRLQMSVIGHPVVGDLQYGATTAFGDVPADSRDAAIALHAWILGFRHPMTTHPVRALAPLPATWRNHLPATEIERLREKTA